jgi:sirohydrochlorin ferrochelatase
MDHQPSTTFPFAFNAPLLQAAHDLIAATEATLPGDYQRRDTLLLVVGTDHQSVTAQANLSKFTRLLWEGLAFGWGLTAYLSVIQPTVTTALQHADRLGFRKVLLLPVGLDAGSATVLQQTGMVVISTPLLHVREGLPATEPANGNVNCLHCCYRGSLPRSLVAALHA